MSEKKKAEEGFLYNANYNAALLDERAWCKDCLLYTSRCV